MSNSVVAAIVITGFLTYFFGMGITAGLLGWTRGKDWEHPGPIFWPLLLVGMLGVYVSDRATKLVRRKNDGLPKARVVK